MPDVMQVIPRTYDLILWLVPRLKEFPRGFHFVREVDGLRRTPRDGSERR